MFGCVCRLVSLRDRVISENDDADGSTTNSNIVDFRLPADGTYTIVATRYESEYGFTTGDFTLALTSSSFTPPGQAQQNRQSGKNMF